MTQPDSKRKEFEMNAIDATAESPADHRQAFVVRSMNWTDRLIQTLIFAAAVAGLGWCFHTIQDTRDRVLALEVEIRGENGLTTKVGEIYTDVRSLVKSEERRAGAEAERAAIRSH